MNQTPVGQHEVEVRISVQVYLTYIPSYYSNQEDWQVANQQAVYNFKKGIISEEHKRKILETVNSIVKDRWDEWAICFKQKKHEKTELPLDQKI